MEYKKKRPLRKSELYIVITTRFLSSRKYIRNITCTITLLVSHLRKPVVIILPRERFNAKRAEIIPILLLLVTTAVTHHYPASDYHGVGVFADFYTLVSLTNNNF